jgi:hypothetical protein
VGSGQLKTKNKKSRKAEKQESSKDNETSLLRSCSLIFVLNCPLPTAHCTLFQGGFDESTLLVRNK